MEKTSNNVRELALKILYKINSQKAYSNIVLDDEMNKYDIDKRDKSLLTKLVYGTLTYIITLDYIISKYSNIKIKKISPWILEILRIGIYQIIYLDKIPKRAVVNESVELAKKYGHKASSGFVNAILKRIEPNELSTLSFDTQVEKISVLTSHPEWLIQLFLKEYDIDTVSKICEYNNIEPPIYVRVNNLKIGVEELEQLLHDMGIDTKRIDNIDNVLKLNTLSNVLNSDLFKKGYLVIQDAAATLTGLVLDARENENILDMCSAPGGKTTHIAQLMNNMGNIIACDIYDNRLKLVNDTADRLGINIIQTKINDGTVLNENFIDKFDRVLVDAPCSGFGVIRRKVDIKYQKEFEDLKQISDIQFKILNNAGKYVKPNGILVYSTCTILKQENEDVIQRFLKQSPLFEVVDISSNIHNNCLKEKYIKTLPHIQNFDGFFIAKLIRREI